MTKGGVAANEKAQVLFEDEASSTACMQPVKLLRRQAAIHSRLSSVRSRVKTLRQL
ncbi:MAG: hypothetical protein ACLSA6_03095 [Holdemania massiliensis]